MAYFTDILRSIYRSINKYVSILLIVALGVGVFAGIKSTSRDMKITADDYYDKYDLMDINILSASGISEEAVSVISGSNGVDKTEAYYSQDAVFDFPDKSAAIKIVSMPGEINTLKLREGRYPEKENECVLVSTVTASPYTKIGMELKSSADLAYVNESYTIVGLVDSPRYVSFQLGSSSVGSGSLDYIMYVLADNFTMPVYSEVCVTVSGAKKLDTFTEKYQCLIDESKADIEKKLNDFSSDYWYVLDRDYISGFTSFENDAQRIDAISSVFPVFFFIVAALVCLTTMTRMVDEERTQIGTYKALGYGRLKIAFKYIFYVSSASVIGSLAGLLLGCNLFPRAIFEAYLIMYSMPPIVTPLFWDYSLYSCLVAVFSSLLFTLYACLNTLKEAPASLMRPRSPKSGKRVLIEHVSFIWKRLSFIRKITTRNLFRYKKRFWMTVLGIAGCTALMLTGFGLKNSISDIIHKQFSAITLYDLTISLNTAAAPEEVISVLASDPILMDKTLENEYEILDEYKAEYMLYYTKYASIYSENDTYFDAYILSPDCTEDTYGTVFTQFFSLHSRERNAKNRDYYSLTNDGVIITEKLARELNVSVGDSVSFSVTASPDKVAFTVDAIAENYVYSYVYILPELFDEAFGTPPFFSNIAANLPDDISEEELSSKLLDSQYISSVNFIGELKTRFDEAISSLNVVVAVLIACAAALAFIVLYNLSNVNITERKRELATIKVLGFNDLEVSSYVFRESVALTFIGTAIGLVLGIALHAYVIQTAEIDSIMFGRDIYTSSFLLSALLTFVFSAFVNYIMHFRLKHISMVDSLKSVD